MPHPVGLAAAEADKPYIWCLRYLSSLTHNRQHSCTTTVDYAGIQILQDSMSAGSLPLTLPGAYDAPQTL